MNYDINMIKYRKSGFFRIAAAILMICFTLLGLTACAGTTDSKDNNDDNALIQGTWEIDTGSGAGYKFVDDKFMWLKSIENVNDNYWYGDVEYYNGAEAMEIAGLTEEELQSSLPGLKPENIFVTKLDPEKIITDCGKDLATIDELAVLDGGKCILQLRGVRPFLSDKFDITKHPNYKYLSDASPKNNFDIEKYLSTRLKTKADDVYEVYEVDASDESATA